ncbi:PP2C family serine/threonine-protein phosphatase [Desulfamplus magnetovallimortis]|nr:PP2C family serine/threonine-protein phosphatase [Desulfamplus magnetovallimortis]
MKKNETSADNIKSDSSTHNNLERYHKYQSLCHELLNLHDLEETDISEIKSFIQEPSATAFFKNMAQHFIELWESWQKTFDNYRKSESALEFKDALDTKNRKKSYESQNNKKRDKSKAVREIESIKENPNVKDTSKGVIQPGFSAPCNKKTDKETSLDTPKADHNTTSFPATENDKSSSSSIEDDKDSSTATDDDKSSSAAIEDYKNSSPATDYDKSSSSVIEDYKISSSATEDDKTSSNRLLMPALKFPNATCGKPYSEKVEVSRQSDHEKAFGKSSDSSEDHIKILSIKGLEAAGLSYNAKEQLISGTPSASGEIKLEITFELSSSESEKTCTTESIFIVNPDPRSLWQNKPSDKSVLFWKEDEYKEEIVTAKGWSITGASKRGRSHAHEGKTRDDHFFISTDSSTEWDILAVADGAGSASLSREGAKTAVMESSRILKEKLKEYDTEIINLLLGLGDNDFQKAQGSEEAQNSGQTKNSEKDKGFKKEDDSAKNQEKKLKNILYNVFSRAVYEPVKVIHDTVENLKKQKSLHEKTTYEKTTYEKTANGKTTNGKTTNGKTAYGKTAYEKTANGKTAYGKTANGKTTYGNPSHEIEPENIKFRDFHTTLLLAAHKEIEGKHFIASYWIGDGAVAVYCEGKSITILGEGDSGEFAGQTRFLDNSAVTSEDIYKRIQFDFKESITALILMTDGITDPFFETDHNLNQIDFWDDLWKNQLKPQISGIKGETAQNILNWLDFWSQGNHDDRTVAMLFKKSE